MPPAGWPSSKRVHHWRIDGGEHIDRHFLAVLVVEEREHAFRFESQILAGHQRCGGGISHAECARHYIFATVGLYFPYACGHILNDNYAINERIVALL